MNLICIRRCFDYNGNEYQIGGKYKYYEEDYVYSVPYNDRMYNIYIEIDGNDVYMGNGTINYINFNFSANSSKLEITKVICLQNCYGPNARRYKVNSIYKYCLKEVCYSSNDVKYYIMYDDNDIWMSYVKMSFIEDNFIKYDECYTEYMKLDALFDKYLLEV